MSWTFLLKVWPLFRCSCMAAFGCSLRPEVRLPQNQMMWLLYLGGRTIRRRVTV